MAPVLQPNAFELCAVPMKIGSPFPYKKARIEIIPLIDIMFFFLASFLMASLSMMRLQAIRDVDLPKALTAKRDFKPDIVNISVKASGDIFYEKQPVNLNDLQKILANAYQKNTNSPVYISADKETKHGVIVRVLDVVRREGIQKVSFSIAPGA